MQILWDQKNEESWLTLKLWVLARGRCGFYLYFWFWQRKQKHFSHCICAHSHSPKNLMLGLLILFPHGINITNVAVPVYSDELVSRSGWVASVFTLCLHDPTFLVDSLALHMKYNIDFFSLFFLRKYKVPLVSSLFSSVIAICSHGAAPKWGRWCL